MDDQNKPTKPNIPKSIKQDLKKDTVPPPPSEPAPAVEKPDESEKWLWVDPSQDDQFLNSRTNVGAVLLAEDITHFVQKYNILIDRKDFDEGRQFGAKLKGASYTMSPDPNDAWMIDENERLIKLDIKPDPSGPYFVVPKNSLVFIKLKQKLRVPFYIIGRHNLKITYVYQGLLLGTGPQVDPGFVGYLHIPLHNFTTKDVNVYLNDSFVSIDFVKTTPLRFNKGVPATLDELYKVYDESMHLFDRNKLVGRATLIDYLKGNRPQSALVEFIHHYKEMKTVLEKTRDQTEKIQKDLSNRIETEITNFRESLKTNQANQESRATALEQRVGNSENIDRIGAVVVAGILVAAMIAMITWFNQSNEDTRTQLSESLIDKTSQMNRDLLLIKSDQEEALKKLHLELSNAILSISAAQHSLNDNQSNIVYRLNQIEFMKETHAKQEHGINISNLEIAPKP